MGFFMKIEIGKRKVKNGRVVEIQEDKEGYYAIVDNQKDDGSRKFKDRLRYDNEGRCYKDEQLGGAIILEASRTPENSKVFANWDLIEEEIKVLKRNSNPILTLDLCTE